MPRELQGGLISDPPRTKERRLFPWLLQIIPAKFVRDDYRYMAHG